MSIGSPYYVKCDPSITHLTAIQSRDRTARAFVFTRISMVSYVPKSLNNYRYKIYKIKALEPFDYLCFSALDCLLDVCKNDAVCIPRFGDPAYKCTCTAGYTGKQCQSGYSKNHVLFKSF